MRALAVFMLSAQALGAEPPLSAIDWLSESLSKPPNFQISPPNPLNSLLGNSITSSSLDLVSRDAVGLLPPEITGFPIRLWGNMPADQVIVALQNHVSTGVPELHRLYRNLLLAQADPPIASGGGQSPFLARIDLLMQMGALDEAETLINLAGIKDAEIFRRWFDISILANRTRAACAALAQTPNLTDDVSTRVICLARGGDWNAAAITLSLSASLGDLDHEREKILIRFLDPGMFEGAKDPEIPKILLPIDFALREALALARPTTLPLMFLGVDMGIRIPQRRRMEAAERLVQSAAIPTSLLFAAYRGGRPASSGGVWGRANAVQQLDLALINEDDEGLEQALTLVYTEFAEVGLLPAVAEEYVDALAHRARTNRLKGVADKVQTLLLLENTPISAWVDPSDSETEKVELARILASRIPVLGLSPYDDPVLSAIYVAFAGEIPKLNDFGPNMELIDQKIIGAAVLAAIQLLAQGRGGNPANIHEGLYLLLQAGQTDSARRIAIQILLTDLP